MKIGTVTLPTCTYTKTSGTGSNSIYDIKCGSLSIIKMKGNISSTSNYRLESINRYTPQTLINNWLNTILKGNKSSNLFSTVLGYLTGGVPLANVKLGLSNDKTFYLKGTIDFSAGTSTNVGKGLKKLDQFLKKYIGSGYNSPMPYEVVFSMNGQNGSLKMSVIPFTGCVGRTISSSIGTKFNFNQSTLFVQLDVGSSGVAISAGMEGKSYIKLTKLDPWLLFKPNLNLAFSSGSVSLTIQGKIDGACSATCAGNCSCSACNADWHPLGVTDKISLKNGTIEFGAALTGPTPNPVITLSFDATIGKGSNAFSGTFLGSFDIPKKKLAMKINMATVRLKPLLEVLTGATGLTGLPIDVRVNNLQLSYSMSPTVATFVHNGQTVTIPPGAKIDGTLNYNGVTGVLAVNNKTNNVSLDSIQSGAALFAVAGPPQGTIEFSFDLTDLYNKVIKDPILASFLNVIKATFAVREVNVKLKNNAGGTNVTYAASISAAFTLFYTSHNLSVGSSIAFSPKDVAVEMAKKVKSLAEGDFQNLYDGIKNAAKNLGKAIAGAATEVWDGLSSVFKSKINVKLKCNSNSGYSVVNGCHEYVTKSKKVKAKCGNGCTKSAGDVCTSSGGSKGSGNFFERNCTFSKVCQAPATCGGCWKTAVNSSLRLNCVGSNQGGDYIYIISASFGQVGAIVPKGAPRPPGYACTQSTTCHNSNSLATVKSICQGKKSCLLFANTATFGSMNCPPSGLQVEYICTDCPMGHYKINGECRACPYGTYQDKAGRTSCIACPSGQTTKYQASTSADACTGCPESLNCTYGCYYNNGQAYCKCQGGAIGGEEYCSGNTRYTCRLSTNAGGSRTRLGSCTHGCATIDKKTYCQCAGGRMPDTEYCSNGNVVECEKSTNISGFSLTKSCRSGCEMVGDEAVCKCDGGYSHGQRYCDGTDRTECEKGKRLKLNPCLYGCYMSNGSPYCKCQGGQTAGYKSCSNISTKQTCDLSIEPTGAFSNELCVASPCQNGVCVCPTGRTYCPTAGCRELQIDPRHCGACGNQCGPGQQCQNGTCQ
jgi:hypothetical protein